MPKPSGDQIRTRVHQMSEAARKPEGRDRELWIEAERQLTEDSRTIPTRNRIPFSNRPISLPNRLCTIRFA